MTKKDINPRWEVGALRIEANPVPKDICYKDIKAIVPFLNLSNK